MAASIGGAAGWILNDQAEGRRCNYLANGYELLPIRTERLSRSELEHVPEHVLGDIQRCWAANPYGGPQHSLALTDARKLSAARYYVAFEPLGITDVQIVFLVDRKDGVIGAFQRSTQ
ncbi:hypothetical protein [Novosphingobium sp. Chol11]|uniref:hypothetical protein n=1 Tax=Novosphingobium sp. Chol11 TaxID=1385763 RepID=UPI000BE4743B|nr:hypothetical protein [Novosphingobium sp. Chol11]